MNMQLLELSQSPELGADSPIGSVAFAAAFHSYINMAYFPLTN